MNFPEANRSDIWIRIFHFSSKTRPAGHELREFSPFTDWFHVIFLTTAVYNNAFDYEYRNFEDLKFPKGRIFWDSSRWIEFQFWPFETDLIKFQVWDFILEIGLIQKLRIMRLWVLILSLGKIFN